MDAQERRPKSNRKYAAESRSLDTGTKQPHLQGEIGYPGYFTSLILPRTPRNPITAKIMNGNIDIDWTKYMSRLDYGGTRLSQTRNIAAKPMGLKKCKSDFWFRACQLANVFNDYFKEDFLLNPNYKNKLLQVYKAFFRQIYDETNHCTWRLLCDCSTCKDR